MLEVTDCCALVADPWYFNCKSDPDQNAIYVAISRWASSAPGVLLQQVCIGLARLHSQMGLLGLAGALGTSAVDPRNP